MRSKHLSAGAWIWVSINIVGIVYLARTRLGDSVHFAAHSIAKNAAARVIGHRHSK